MNGSRYHQTMTHDSKLRISAVVGVLMLTGCGDCIGSAQSPDSRGPVDRRDVSEPLTQSSSGAAYREARRQANKEITAANVEDKLEALRREIDGDNSYEAIE